MVNTKSMELQSYQAWQAANLQINIAMSSNPTQSQIIAAGLVDSTNLTEESWFSFYILHMAILQMAQTADYFYRSGSLDRELWESETERAALTLFSTGVRQMWEAGAKSQLTPRFAERLESTQSKMAFVNWDAQRGFFHDDTSVGKRISEPDRSA